MHSRHLAALAVVALGIALGGALSAQAPRPAGSTRTDLRRHDLSTPGQEVLQARVDFAPGASFPAHRHRGDERVLLLEGGYVDDSGTEYGPGDLHEMPKGSSHGFRVLPDEPCVAAAVYRGRLRFASWPLRLLAWILRR